MTTFECATFDIIDDGTGLRVGFNDGVEVCLHCRWLRENAEVAHSSTDRHVQKRVLAETLPKDLHIVAARYEAEGTISLIFSDADQPRDYSLAWLRLSAVGVREPHVRGTLLSPSVETFANDLDLARVTFDYPQICRSSELERQWLECVHRLGFARLRAVPCRDGAVEEVVARFGFVRETNYGRVFDVRVVADPINLAYSGEGLQVHTDNPYRDPVPTLQLLHCLSSDADGGDSVVVDGFAAAVALRQRSPDAFSVLNRSPVEYRFDAADVALRARRAVIETNVDGQISSICFNNRALAPLPLAYSELDAFYAAYSLFAAELNAARARVRFRMGPGELFIVDNRRVLHGREAYSSKGLRHLQGCYADIDALRSRLAVAERENATAA